MKKKMKTWAMAVIATSVLSGCNTIGNEQKEQTLFVWGGDINAKFTQYIADLTGKSHPRICYLPTASADHGNNIKAWEHICGQLQLDTLILKVWEPTPFTSNGFAEPILTSDAIVVGGGNTLNMLGIWKAQGIDRILKQAAEQGIILAGASAGSICWFENGISDSRPEGLSVVDGLGLLSYSTCPHYSQPERRSLYHRQIEDGKMNAGYAMDELAGILFKAGKAVECVTQSDLHNCYYVTQEKGETVSKYLPGRLILYKGALAEHTYKATQLGYTVQEVPSKRCHNAIESYIDVVMKRKDGMSEEEKRNIRLEMLFEYDNRLIAVVNDAYLSSLGYVLHYFYNNEGTWQNMGEDLGGRSMKESEVVFREKASAILQRAIEKYVPSHN